MTIFSGGKAAKASGLPVDADVEVIGLSAAGSQTFAGGKVPLGDEQMGKLVRIDRAEMNRQLDNWAELWRREVEGKR